MNDAERDGCPPAEVDVLIVGAGISGIGTAYHLKTERPGTSFAVVEARDSIGGTWDLFRYPGVRSDSDLHTLGFEFNPWRKKHSYAGGEEILEYLHETVAAHGLAPYLHLGHRVVRARFSSDTGRWTVTLRHTHDGQDQEGGEHTVTCRFLFSATGYYDYDEGYTPPFEGRDEFRGRIVHPQFWPDDLDHRGKRVVVIGSGATAVTLVPALAEDAAHVTMLQRSPSYVLVWPRENKVVHLLRSTLPEEWADRAVRRLSVRLLHELYRTSRRAPGLFKAFLRRRMTRVLPDDYPVDVHFNPSYEPWDQRLCVAPDADLFEVIAAGTASVVTDRIERFTPTGIALESGRELEADIVVTATGLKMLPFGRIDLEVDGTPVDLHECITYKATMLTGVPNYAFAFGYTNSSWTLKVDLAGHHLCRLLDHMDRRGYAVVTPVCDDPAVGGEPFWDLTSNYILRAKDMFPQSGSDGPWSMEQNYYLDRARLIEQPVDHPALRFERVVPAARVPAGQPTSEERTGT
ncbi:NAD(P)/FAD-dependent oxidoreductase [Rhodococcus sp. Z13]|uniref:NAD(P)/FAD-dependent oxidoreductase n=1 Tax=Rhodococcus sacchari TaxID=2962047 RepID=A0ACD4DJE8_9NOCA|nr:NAD(P)/FAD-dependent oxidoreductase [Rhodococcus sp. Z13]UYP20156.1 NAD(P)/FAD-dependent oxidoreductase [Rhodococcus sp. Z13]